VQDHSSQQLAQALVLSSVTVNGILHLQAASSRLQAMRLIRATRGAGQITLGLFCAVSDVCVDHVRSLPMG